MENFNEVYDIMKVSFPVEEIRTYAGQKNLLAREDYHLKTYVNNEKIVGFCAYYILDQFIYIEHLACLPTLRGRGIGTRLLKQVLNEVKDGQMVILEVEPEIDKITKRRIEFYEGLGFKLNEYAHYQPPLRDNTDVVELKLMSYPLSLNEETHKKYRSILNEEIYHVSRNFKL